MDLVYVVYTFTIDPQLRVMSSFFYNIDIGSFNFIGILKRYTYILLLIT